MLLEILHFHIPGVIGGWNVLVAGLHIEDQCSDFIARVLSPSSGKQGLVHFFKDSI